MHCQCSFFCVLGIVRSATRNLPPAHYTFQVKNFSIVKTIDKCESAQFEVGGYQWCVNFVDSLISSQLLIVFIFLLGFRVKKMVPFFFFLGNWYSTQIRIEMVKTRTVTSLCTCLLKIQMSFHMAGRLTRT